MKTILIITALGFIVVIFTLISRAKRLRDKEKKIFRDAIKRRIREINKNDSNEYL